MLTPLAAAVLLLAMVGFASGLLLTLAGTEEDALPIGGALLAVAIIAALLALTGGIDTLAAWLY